MSWKTDHWMGRYSSLLEKGQDLPRGNDSTEQDAGFFLRQQTLFRNPETGKNRQGMVTEEVYGSAAECLSSIRWYKIPSRLREITGLNNENDIEKLLDAAGYRSSLVAEELFDMIDGCLKSHIITTADLDTIRKAYNGISGFRCPQEHRITEWGYEKPSRTVLRSGICQHSPVLRSSEAVAG